MNQLQAMSDLAAAPHPLRRMFLGWQARARLIAMRQNMGKPDEAITPALTLAGDSEPLGHVITVMPKGLGHSKTPELRHMVLHTNDPAQRLDKALQFFRETYYQDADSFSGALTATFQPGSPGAERIVGAGTCTLTFKAYSQRFDLVCAAARLAPTHPLYQASWWHNLLFNPNLHPDSVIVGFKPDWHASSAEPAAQVTTEAMR